MKPSWLVRDIIRREDKNTNYNDLAPVKKAFQMTIVYFSDGKDNASLAMHREKLPSYVWQSEEGITCSGTNGAQVRDTAITVLAVAQAGLAHDDHFK